MRQKCERYWIRLQQSLSVVRVCAAKYRKSTARKFPPLSTGIMERTRHPNVHKTEQIKIRSLAYEKLGI